MESDETHDGLITQFCAIAGADTERAKFYLESSAWNIATALASFYEGDDDPGIASSGAERAVGAEDLEESPQETGAPSMPRVRMTADDCDSSSEGEEEAFYAGGSEHSGQQILGPRRKKSDVISQLFRSAREHGAEVVEGADPKKDGKKLTFKGTGYRLGEKDDDHEVIPGEPEPQQPKDVVLNMWKNGFSIDDGPVRDYDDPSNLEFLNSIRRGEIPMELIRAARGGEVYLSVVDRRQDEYMVPRKKVQCFSGAGHTLGSPAPNVVGQVTQTGYPGGAVGRTVSAAAATAPRDAAALNEEAQRAITIDPSQPTTSIQVRHPDGSRMVLKLNHTNTVGNIRGAVVAAHPQLANTPFALMTTFPYTELTNFDLQIKEANLLNAALVVKLK